MTKIEFSCSAISNFSKGIKIVIFVAMNPLKQNISKLWLCIVLLTTFSLFLKAQSLSDSLIVVSTSGSIEQSRLIPKFTDWKNIKNELKNQKSKSGVIFIKSKFWKAYSPEGILIVDSISKVSVFNDKAILIRKNYALGLLDFYGNKISDPVYSEIKFQNDLILGKPQNLIAIYDPAFKQTHQYRWNSLQFLTPNLVVFDINNKKGLFNITTNDQILNYVYDEIRLFNDTLFTVRDKNKWGMANISGELIVPIEYSAIERDTFELIKLKKERLIDNAMKTIVGISNYMGRIIIAPMYDDIAAYTYGYFPVKKDKFWGYFNTEGEQVIPFFYDKYGKFVSGVAAVQKAGQFGIIDKNANWIAFPEYDAVKYVNDSLWVWRRDRLAGFYSTINKQGIPYMYEYLEPINDRFIIFTQSGKFGLLSAKRQTVLAAEWDKIQVFDDEKIILASKNNYYSIFYHNGNLKVFMNYPFSRFEPYHEGMAMVVHKNKYGFIDKDGLLLISTQYDEARPFVNGLAAIRINEKWGFVNDKEKFVVQPYYDQVADFSIGAAIVKKNKKYGLVNKAGKETSKPVYDEIKPLVSGNFLLTQEGRFGIADKNGLETINPIYKDVVELKPGIFKVRLYSKYGLVNLQNRSINTNQYDYIEYDPITDQYIFTTKYEWKALK